MLISFLNVSSILISEWLIQKVAYFKFAQQEGKGSGIQARCSMNTELKILKQLFSWYKEEAEFDEESKSVSCPIKNRTTNLVRLKRSTSVIKRFHQKMFLDYFKV